MSRSNRGDIISFHILAIMAMVCLSVAACASSEEIPDPTPNPMLAAAQPTSTITAIPPPTLTLLPSPTITLQPVPTLTHDELGSLMSDIVSTNGGCELPCFWNITPGVTTFDEVQQNFVRVGVPFKFYEGISLTVESESTRKVEDVEYGSNYRVFLGIDTNGDVVETIRLYGDRFQAAPNFEPWEEGFAWYSILKRLGPPTQVLVTTPADYVADAPDPDTHYTNELVLVYDSLGMTFDYYWNTSSNDRFDYCPAFTRVLSVELKIMSPESMRANPRALLMHQDTYPWWLTPLEEWAGMDVNEFYPGLSDTQRQAVLYRSNALTSRIISSPFVSPL